MTPAAPTSSLRPDALVGRTLVLTGARRSGLAQLLSGLGAQVHEDAPPAGGGIDLLVIDLPAGSSDAGSPDAPAAAQLPESISDAFRCVRDVRPALAARGGGVLLLCPGGPEPAAEVTAAAALSLARTLAQEWAPEGIRANAAVLDGVPADQQLADLVALLAGPAAAMLTGQQLHLRAGSAT